MHRTLLLLMLLNMMIHHNNGFYIKEPNTPPKNSQVYSISSDDLYSLPKCEEKVTFNHNENVVITYIKRYQEINANLVSDVFLELSALGNDVAQQTCNISGVTLNMTQCKLHGNSVIIRLSPSFCNQRKLAITTHFTVYIDGTVNPEDQCPDPGIPENSHSNRNNGDFVIGTKVEFSCYEGYVMSGFDAISCIRDPHTDIPVWSGDKPKCLRQCEVPSAPKYGSVSQLSSDGSVSFTCLSPFTLVGPKTITCLQNGAKTTWDKFPPKCVVTRCPSNEHVISAMTSTFIATPGFPGEIVYPNMTCQWNIRARDDGCVHIYFETFDIPNNAVFEIHKFVGSINGEESLVWSSRSGGGGPVTVCGDVIRVSYTSGEVAVTGHGGVQMWYQARPISEYHAAYQRAARIGFNDQVSVEPTKATGQTRDDNGSGVDVAAIAAGVTVTVIVLIVVGVGIYIWYRKKYPVRMIIGKDFGKFTNPAYNRKTSTATLTRPDSFEKEIQKMASETCVSHDNPVDLSDEQEYQPTAGLTLLGSLGIREGLDDLDSPEIKKRNNTRQRRKIVPSTKVVIEEEEEADKDEVKKISDSSDSSSSDNEKSDASDENSDGEGFRPVTDAPKIKRKRVSAYLNEVLDRQSSQDSADGDADCTIKEEMIPSDGTDKVLHIQQHNQKQNEEVMPIKEGEVNTNDAVDESADDQNDNDAVEQNEENKHVSAPDRPMTVLKLGSQDFKFTDEGSSQSSTSLEEDDIKEESSKTENNPTPDTKHEEVDFTPEEIITEVNNLLQKEAQFSNDNTVQLCSDVDVNKHESASDHPKDTEKEINEIKATINETSGSEQVDEVGRGNFPDGNELSTNEVDMLSESTDLMNEVSNEYNNTSTIPSLLGEIQQDSVDQLNDSNGSHHNMAEIQTDAAVIPTVSESTTGALDGIDQNTHINHEIIGYLTKDEMREFTARSKSFGEDSIDSVYSGEMVEVDNPVAEIPEQEFSSGLSIDETDNLEVPYKSKAELQFEKLIHDIDNSSSSADIEKVDNVIEIVNQEEIRSEKEETLISPDLSAGNPTNGEGGETSDFISHFDNSDKTVSQTVNASLSPFEEFGNVTENIPTQPLLELSFVGDTNISRVNPLVQPVKLLMSGFDIGESSTDTHSEISPDNQIGNESNSEDDSDSSKMSDKNVIEYIINPETLETSDEEDEDDDHVDELQRITEAGGKGKRRSISLENPLFDTLDFSQFQQNSLDSKQEDSDKESENDTEMKPSLIRRRESVSLDNPFFDTDDHEVQTQPHQGEKLKVIQVSNLLITPPTSSNESSDEDSDSETGSVGEYQINPPSDHEENQFSDREDNASSKQAENALYGQSNDPSKHQQQQPPDIGLPVGVMDFSALEQQSGHANNLENTIPLHIPSVFDHRKKVNLDAPESDVSSLDSTTMKEIDNLSSDSEASNQDNGKAQANAPAQKRFSLSSISRKLKSSFKTTGKSDLQTGDNDMVDV